jgi:hypothetical protein
MAPLEASMIEVFVRAASLVGLPRLIGEIYGLLYCASGPLTFDTLVARLNISKGSRSARASRSFGNSVQFAYIMERGAGKIITGPNFQRSDWCRASLATSFCLTWSLGTSVWHS